MIYRLAHLTEQDKGYIKIKTIQKNEVVIHNTKAHYNSLQSLENYQ